MSQRPRVTDKEIEEGIITLRAEIQKRLCEKGCGAWLSTDEIRGVIQRELHELDEAIHTKNLTRIRDELLDIGVACVFGAICIDNVKVEW